jgi:amino acid adenylation domain-containing protein
MTSIPSVADREKLLKAARAARLQRKQTDTAPILPGERGERPALSFAQQRLWFLEQLGGTGRAYHLAKSLRLQGELDRDALRRALDRIVARHEALRTTFQAGDPEPVQVIHAAEESPFHLVEHDLTASADADAELRRLTAEEAGAPFDLEHGPLIRGRLVRLGAEDHVLLVTMHHIVSDGWSMEVVIQELSALYTAFRDGAADPLPPLPVQYADYAAWQRRWVTGEVLQKQGDYWKESLSGAPELLELPTDRARPLRQDHSGALAEVVFDEELTAALRALSQRHGSTLFMTLLAGWAAVLARLSGQGDVVIGTPTANRGRAETERLIGFFVNTLALRLDLAGSPSVGALLERVRTQTLTAQGNQDIPFEQVVELARPARSLAHAPLFQVMFTWQGGSKGSLELPGLTLSAGGAATHVTAKFDLSLSLQETGSRITGGLTYATALFDAETADRWLGYLRNVLQAIVADEAASIDTLPMLPAAERAQVVTGWNATDADFPTDVCIHEMFEAQVERTPSAPALTFEGETLSYAELNARANRLAHHLRTLGVGPDTRVAVCVERSVEMVVALFGILKAGGAYLPLDPAYPEDRLRYMLADGAPAVVLTQASLAGLFDGCEVPCIDLTASQSWDDQPATNPARIGTPANLAYVIYTSGSTGMPKGVMNAHRGVINRLVWMQDAYGLTADESVLQKTPFSFDVSVWEFFWPLMVGARLVVAKPEGHKDPSYLVETIRRENISTLHFVPSMLQLFLEHADVESCTSLARVMCSGEALPAAAARRFRERLPMVGLHNLYGPTEAAVDVTAWSCPAEAPSVVPIGSPIANTRIYLLDNAGQPVPVGVSGELYIAGVQVARGYLNRPSLTAERFVIDPFSTEPGARMYRTGDLARWLSDGTIEYLGRTDFQVKVRGFRIELGEIESRLLEHEEIRESVVLAREDSAGDKRLVGYYVSAEPIEVEALRAHLSANLPDYMVPSAFVHLTAMPLNANGKADRKKLPAPEGAAFGARAYEAPVGEVEQAVAAVWAEVLRVERVGRVDHFFDMGGHSLLAVQVVSRIRQALGVDSALGDIFQRPVLADFARGLETAERTELPSIAPGQRGEVAELSFAQQRLWFLEQLGGAGAAYHIPAALRLRGELDRWALGRALDRIVERHEALRTTFEEVDGVPVQRFAPAAGARLELAEHDLAGHADAEAEVRRLAGEEARAPFDLAAGPLIRGRIVRLADDDHVLLLTMHHVVSDGWSTGVLVGELGALYAAFRAGDADPLPPLPVQYADYSAWQRRTVTGDALQRQADFWKATLAGAPELLELPADRPRPAQQDPAGAIAAVELDAELTAALKALGQRHGATLFMTLLAGWATVLARLSGEDDVVIGTPTANRGRAELERLIGFFVNTLALRVDLGGEPTVADVLERVKAAALAAQHNQDIAFEQVVELVKPVRSLSHAPLFQVMFAWQNTPQAGLELPGLKLEPLDRAAGIAAKFDLSLALGEVDGRVVGAVTYATSLYDEATIQRYVGYLRAVLAEMAADDAKPVHALPLLSEIERRQVVEEWNATDAEFASDATFHELFQAQVEATPVAVALVQDEDVFTYAALNARANRLAQHLRGLGVRPDARVAICVERSPQMVIAVLAVMKAGGAYVPLDPAYPTDRLRYMLDDSAPVALLTQASLAGLLGDVSIPVVALDADAERWADAADTNPSRDAVGLRPEHLAYVIYTSGSTGRPKGVMVRHRGVCNLVAAQVRAFPVDAESRILQFASFSFDACVFEMAMALTRGAALHLPPRGGVLAGEALVEMMAEQGITHVTLPPAVLAALPDDAEMPSVRMMVLAGDVVTEAVARRWGAGRQLFNAYGPTETTVWATLHECDATAAGNPPIGRPIANTRVYVLDGRGEPVPVGVAGELCVGGAGVARGYLDRPDLTADRFVADPFSGEADARLYRTGDRARRLADGTVEFMGRNDFQVKLRGFRIELGEIESRLAEHPQVREAAVLAREDSPGDKRLVAYYVAAESTDLEVDVLRAHVAERLPEHMVPAAYVRLDALPLTPNGKLDRRALPAPGGAAYAARAYEAPAGATEEALAQIWADVLGAERVGRGDHFFDLGGHSLLAVQVVSRIRQALNVEVALRDLFARPVLAEFAAGLEGATRADLPAITRAEGEERQALSFAQQRLWVLEQMGAAGRAYHIPTSLRLAGVLDRDALGGALDRIVARHEALRTTFATVDGQPVQVIAPVEQSGFAMAEHDLRGSDDADAELRALLREEAGARFDLEHGPLIRGRLIRLGDEDHVLLVTMHHIVSDGWSMGVLTQELSALYAAFRAGAADPLPALPIQYADYAAWQRRWVDGEVLREQADYWKRTLAGAPELLELPADRPRPAQQSHAGAFAGLELDAELTGALKELSRRHGTTLFMTLLAGWAAVLARLSRQDDVVIGTPTANRGRAEIEGLIGFFVNTLALRVDLSDAPTVTGLLRRVKGQALAAQQHQDIPFEQVVDLVQPTRSMAHTPLFQVLFTWQSAPKGTLDLPGLTLGPVSSGGAAQVMAKFDLSLDLHEAAGRIGGGVTYATALFDATTVERCLGYLRNVLQGMVADEAGSIDTLPMLPAAERAQVVNGWNSTDADYPTDACIHEMFEAQVERTPSAPALTFEGETLSYSELNARANRLAHHLRTLGVGPDTRVAVCVERSVQMVVALYGILKAGGAYLPLDPAYPEDRLRYMLADGAPAVVLTQASLAGLFVGCDVPCIDLSSSQVWDDQPATNPTRIGTPANLAYVIYTSGSTGMPKGVMNAHRGVINRLVWMQDAYGLTADDSVLQKTPFSFDVSVWEFFWPLMVGARLVMAKPEGHKDPSYLVETIRRENVSTLHFVPSMLQLFLEHADVESCTSLSRVMCSGEALPAAAARRFRERLPMVGLHNLYGPTEAAVDVTAWSCPAEAPSVVPIGSPIANTRIYLLDNAGQPVPVGVAGELYIAGVQVARGYLNRPSLTAERFVVDPFSTEAGARMYRTGDLARWLSDGTIEYIGRTDFQVKVRGFRIELGEIESRLLEHEEIREAVVLAREDAAGDKRLVGYYVSGEPVEVEALRAHISANLPEYMVPAAFVHLTAMPLNANGKADRKALPAPEGAAFGARVYEAPLGETETAVAAVWSDVLGIETIGRADDFFALGGHSLRAVQVISRVRQTLGVDASLGDLFQRPVLAEFARGLDAAGRSNLPPIVPAAPEDRAALSFSQQRLWFLEQFGGAGRAYHLPTGLRLRGELDRDALVAALNRIIARHEALRTTFHAVNGQPVQHVATVEDSPFQLAEHDLAESADAEGELRRLLADESGSPFDLERGPLIRGILVRMSPTDHVLFVTMHHIVSDGWSMGVLTRELTALYGAFHEGRPDPLPALPVQYADYAAWQRRWVEGEVLGEQAEFWRRTLAGAPELLEVPADRPRPPRQDYTGATVGVELDEALTAGLKELARRHGATLYMTLLAGWAAVLGRLSRQDDVVIGTPSANRGRSEVEGLIGFFVNTLAVRVGLGAGTTVADLVAQVKAQSLAAQQHQDIPFEQVVEMVQPARSLAHSPIFQVMFSLQNAPESRLELPGLTLGPIGSAGTAHVTAKFDLTLNLQESAGRIVGAVEYATALFDRETVERYAGYLRQALAAMVAGDAQPVEALPLLGDAERRQVVEEWNDTDREFPRHTPVHRLFEAQAARTPHATAAVHGAETLTYAELNARANRLAHHLADRGIAAGERVVVMLPRSIDLVAAELAVVKAGAVYVPIDPTFPADRIAFMAADSGARVVLSLAGQQIPALDGVERIDVDTVTGGPVGNLALEIDGDAAAYVMYTSGSTGTPKGVVVPHRGIARLVIDNGYADFQPSDRVAFAANPAFDATTMEVWGPLLTGGRTVVIDHDVLLDSDAFAKVLAEQGVTAMFLTTAVFNQYAATIPGALAGLRHLMTGGERGDPASFARILREGGPVRLIHAYGPTEATTFAITHHVTSVAEGAQSVPLGRPISNTRIYVLDTAGQPVPVGVSGEIHIGGPGVALGYLNRPDLTAEKFVADPFSDDAGARMYRTGDLGRWLPDGTLEFMGRNDFQVKIRGFRIELGEIEARLLEHADLREAIVLAREDVPGDKRLVAYYASDDAVETEALRAHLAETLPAYMVPAAFVHLDAMPLNANGKVDRKALPAPEAGAFATRGYEAPATETEMAVAEIWGEVLGQDQVGRHDQFFELGGHSLLAVQVISRVRQVLGVDVALGDLFLNPVLADFAHGLDAAGRAELPPIEPAAREGELALSFAQQRLWFLDQLGAAGRAYHIPVRLRLRGDLHRDALSSALERIVARHEALRTTFHEVDGQPVQRVASPEEARFVLAQHDLTDNSAADAELSRLLGEESAARFDLSRGPLIRGGLIHLAADDHVLMVTMHHIVSDGWSMGVLVQELSALYAAFRDGHGDPLPALAVQYADYAAWQRRWVDGDVLQQQADYWKRTLTGAPELLELSADRARPAQQSHAGAWTGVELDAELTEGLRALSQRHGTTLFMTLLAAWATVLARLSGQRDVVVGTPTANRGRREIESLIGFFVNTLAIRVDLSDSPSVADLLARVKGQALAAQQHQDIPFEQVVELVQPARSMAHTALFQVMFAWQNAPMGTLELPGLTLAPVGAAGGAGPVSAKFDLSLDLHEAGGRIAGGVTYGTALFDRATVDRYLGYLRNLLRGMVADETASIDTLSILPAEEREMMVGEWNATETEFPAGACMHHLFEAQAERTPAAVAVTYGDRSLTYAELNAAANRLAHHLRTRGVGPDARVAICVDRSLEMVVGVMAVLKVGGAYVPLDPAYPHDRLRYMLEDSAPVAILTQSSLAGLVADLTDGLEIPAIELDGGAGEWAHQPAENPRPEGLTADHLLYVIYTSGSTGLPKGVMNQHRCVVNRLVWGQREWKLQPGEAVLQNASLSFDVSARELFWPLGFGGRVVMLRPDAYRDPGYLVETIRTEGVRTACFVPSMLQLFLEHPDAARCTELVQVVCSGEALPASVARRFRETLPGVLLHNVYGPSEAATAVASLGCTAVESRATVPIGRPIANTRVYVLDGAGQPVPAGVAGELFIGGTGVARGYFARPVMSAERFVPDPFSGEAGSRLYRTGDLARWLADGTIEFLGRNDFQVKLRGFRIELGEIEARLAAHPAVREAVALVREDIPGDQRLVAYLVGGEDVEVEELRAHLLAALPEYMVPAAYVRLAAMPLTPNGKADRKALPAPEGSAFITRGYEAPATEAEAGVAAVWADVLGLEQVGRHDHFFELGGHSLRAVQVVSRVRQVLGVNVALGDLFLRPVLADFAAGLAGTGRAELPPIERADRGEPMALSFAQQRLWFIEQMASAGRAYHMPTGLRLHGDLDRAALVRALDRIVERHEALRTTFVQVDGRPVQRMAPAEGYRFPLVEHDLTGEADPEAALRPLVTQEAAAPFDFERGPLIRGRLIRVAPDDHVLLVTLHHIVSDGWSMGVLTHEVTALYSAFARGLPDPLPELPIQYADYAAWQRRWVDGEVLSEQADYWKRTLGGAPERLELPTDHSYPSVQDHAGALAGFDFGPELTAGLKALGQRHGTTLFMTLLAGWAAVLGRLSGADDLVVGTPTANRGRREIENLIGFFANTLALRMDLAGSPTVAELLARVKERTLSAQHHQDIPFEQVVELVQPTRSMAHAPLAQVMFTWQNAPHERVELPGLTLGSAGSASQVTAKFDMTLSLSERGGRIVGSAEYRTSLWERATIDRWIGYLRRVLEAMVADERQAVDRLPMLPPAERAQVVEGWNATDADFPREICVHERFQAHAASTPHALAVSHPGGHVTYGELNARANRLAHWLRAHGVGPDSLVAVCIERGPELITALLATLKAGGAYVPLDPAYPTDRLCYTVDDSAPVVLLTQSSLAGLFDGCEVPMVSVDTDAHRWAGQPSTDLDRAGLRPDHLAYVIYTSGSTGRPKGVMVEHRNLANLVAWHCAAFGLEAGDRSSAVAGLAFDATTWEIWPPLAIGAALALPEDARDPEALLDWWAAEELDVCFLPTPLAEYAFARGLVNEKLKTLLVGGDRLRAIPDGLPFALVNNYGPTETTVVATSGEVTAGGKLHIGRPIANTRVYILDPRGEPVPTGVSGELYVGGAGVARGYLNRPELTAERFVVDPFSAKPDARMYRTGDLGRWLPDGTIEFLGRIDFQVKVRGFRIELGEIESRLLEHPALTETIVLAREDVPGDVRLVAYYVAADAVEAEALRAHLSATLPEYMVPAAFVHLAAMPLTPNGKVDRRALPAPEAGAFAARGYEAPATETEVAVAEVWGEVLGREEVGRHDQFFELGGHSLLAVQVISRVRQVLGVDVSLGDLFLRPVLADFAHGLDTAGRAELPPIQPTPREGELALSFAQQRLWFLDQMGAAGRAYHIPVRLRLRGELDRDALAHALERIVARHEALRTTFHEVEGEPVQRVSSVEESRFVLVQHDLTASAGAESMLRRVLAEESGARFDLSRGPLFRGRLVRLGDDDHVLLLTMHHIVSDGWSMGVLVQEMSTLYAAFRDGRGDPLPALPVQYADYSAWQRKWVDGDVLQQQADYWKQTLAGAPELLELPADRPRPAQQSHAGAFTGLELDAELTEGLRALGQRHGTTLFMTLLAAWATVLARLSGQPDVVVGTPTANRGRREIEGLIGFFVNTLAVRVDVSDSPTVAGLLARVKGQALAAQQHQDIPFEQVVELVQPGRSLSHTPLFQVMFAWQNASMGTLELPGLTLAPIGTGGAAPQVMAKFDLSLSLSEAAGRIVGGVEYATSLFERETVDRYLGYLRRVLHEMVADDARTVDALPLLDAAEHDRVVREWNATATSFPADTSVHALFRAQVQRAPHAVAVVHDDRSLTYAELDAAANRIAGALRTRGVRPGDRVAILLPRSTELVAAELAVLRTGAAYVPIDPSFPADRIAFMAADSGARLVLTAAGAEMAGLDGVERIDVDALGDSVSPDVDVAVDGGAPAYVMYTSGSTGQPKGVVVPHRGISRLVIDNGYAEFGPEDRVAFAANPAFDASTLEVWAPLLNGGRVVVVGQDTLLDAGRFGQALVDHEVSVLWLTVGLFNQYADDLQAVWGRLRYLIVGGDALDPRTIERVLRGGAPAHLLNGYGPTETTTFAITHEITGVPEGARSIPLGRPIANTSVYILDPLGQPVPVGVAGEIHVGGAGLALGYLNRPDLTAERFVADPFCGDADARMYRTGDLARWLPDGTVEFLGRNDQQVKVRGYRIELGEIEAALASQSDVRDTIVLAREDVPGDKRLVAYYVAGDAVDAEALRTHLSATLPAYMVPAAFVHLEAMPLTPNGKVDRRALPAPDVESYATAAYEPPMGEVETAIAAIWADVLRVERVGRGDGFFELGGHSLLAARAMSRIRQALGVDLPLADIFSCPTVESLAARVRAPEAEMVHDRAVAVRASGSQRPLFLVHEGTGSIAYAHVLHRHLDAEVPVYALPDLGASEPELRTVQAKAARHLAMIRQVQPAGPYRLAGWSFGGTLAYEIATQLVARDETVEFVGMMDTHYGAGARADSGGDARDYPLMLHTLRMGETGDTPSPAALRELAATAGGMSLEALVERSHQTGVLPRHVTLARVRQVQARLRGNRRAMHEYAAQPLPVPVHLFPALDGAGDPLHGWDAVLSGASTRVTPVPGTHLTMVEGANAAALGHALSAALRNGGGGDGGTGGNGGGNNGGNNGGNSGSGNGGSPVRPESPLVTLRFGQADGAPLFCVPGAGASVASFSELSGHLAAGRPVHAFQPRGVDGIGVPHGSVQAAAEWYLAELRRTQPGGPVHLLGHSFGGWVAFEMASRLRAEGRAVGSLTLLDTEVPHDPGAPTADHDDVHVIMRLVEVLGHAAARPLGIAAADLAPLDEPARLALLHARMVGAALLPRRSGPDVLQGPLRTFAACLRTTYTPAEPYPGPVRLVLVHDSALDAESNRLQFADTARGWRRWAPDLVVTAGEGNHVTALKPPHVASLASLLAV